MKTLNNLAQAFIGESQARNRYTFYAKIAKKEGYEQIAAIFELTADNEREHAKWIMRMINQLTKESGEEITLDEVPVPTVLGTTEENLKSAIEGENHEHTQMYPEFAKTAREEGYPEIAERIEGIAKSEVHHEDRFKKLLKVVQENSVHKKEEEKEWVCRVCGYLHKGKEAPEECPSCSHPKNHYELRCEEY